MFVNSEIPQGLRWTESNPPKVLELKKYCSDNSYRLPFDTTVFGSGRIYTPVGLNKEDGDRLANRFTAVVPSRFGNTYDFNRVICYPTAIDREKSFDATYMSFQKHYGDFLRSKWKTSMDGDCPLVGAKDTSEIVKPDGLVTYATVTEYRSGIKGIGLGGPDAVNHQLDMFQLKSDEEINTLVEMLDKTHAKSSDFQQFLGERRNEKDPKLKLPEMPDRSWLNENNGKCALRGRKWWRNPLRGKKELGANEKWDDRLEELTNHANNGKVKQLYDGIFGEGNFSGLLGKMINSNIKLYRTQDGKQVEGEEKWEGEQVVVHGTLAPDNIQVKRDAEGKIIQYTVTGGDRAQLFGLRGQEIDWLVSSAAASPDLQRKLIDAFIKVQDKNGRNVEKERRGLAMHVMYRSISEAIWYADHNKIDEAKNLINLVHDIVTGDKEGKWGESFKDVNIPIDPNDRKQ